MLWQMMGDSQTIMGKEMWCFVYFEIDKNTKIWMFLIWKDLCKALWLLRCSQCAIRSFCCCFQSRSQRRTFFFLRCLLNVVVGCSETPFLLLPNLTLEPKYLFILDHIRSIMCTGFHAKLKRTVSRFLPVDWLWLCSVHGCEDSYVLICVLFFLFSFFLFNYCLNTWWAEKIELFSLLDVLNCKRRIYDCFK